MSRFTSLAIVIAMTGTAYAQSQAEIAASLNEEGKQLMYQDKPSEAAKKFQEAVARVPEAKYFINLCTARLQEGKLGDALTACSAVEHNNPSTDQKAKASKLIDRINEEAQKQHIELKPEGGGGGDPGRDPGPGPDPTHPTDPTHPGDPSQGPRYAPAVGRPLGQNLVVAAAPDHKYTWTLGIDLFGGGGQIGQTDVYGSATTGFRLKGDYLLNPLTKIGAQGYLQWNHLNKGTDQMSTSGVASLDIIDVGVAGYKHVCLGGTPRLCITPLVGAHVALMSPAGETDGAGSQVFNYAALGGRAELALAYAFGYRYEHVVSVMGGANLYTQVLSGPSDNLSGLGTAEDVGLDKGGAVGYVGLGYTYRFNTPLGSSPFVTLE